MGAPGQDRPSTTGEFTTAVRTDAGVPRSWGMDAARLLDLLRPHLETCGARWMLAGGFALAAYGSTRATADLDLVVDDAARPALVPRLAQEGFETLFDSEGFTNLLHPDPALGRLDLIWVEGTTARKLFAAVSERPGPGGLLVPVPKPEHLVAMKVRAIQGRATRALRDGPDLAFLLSLPGIDENEAREPFLRAGLDELWESLRRRP